MAFKPLVTPPAERLLVIAREALGRYGAQAWLSGQAFGACGRQVLTSSVSPGTAVAALFESLTGRARTVEGERHLDLDGLQVCRRQSSGGWEWRVRPAPPVAPPAVRTVAVRPAPMPELAPVRQVEPEPEPPARDDSTWVGMVQAAVPVSAGPAEAADAESRIVLGLDPASPQIVVLQYIPTSGKPSHRAEVRAAPHWQSLGIVTHDHCIIAGCTLGRWSRGLCSRHYSAAHAVGQIERVALPCNPALAAKPSESEALAAWALLQGVAGGRPLLGPLEESRSGLRFRRDLQGRRAIEIFTADQYCVLVKTPNMKGPFRRWDLHLSSDPISFADRQARIAGWRLL